MRSLRRREGLSQAELARRLRISASYLNLIEANRRPLPAPLLLELARLFRIDLRAFASDEDRRLVVDLVDAFDDPIFARYHLSSSDVQAIADASPAAAHAVLSLFRAYKSAKETAETIGARIFEGQRIAGVDRSRISSEEVSELIEKHGNHFPEIEAGAERLWKDADLQRDDLYRGLVRFLEGTLGVRVAIAPSAPSAPFRRFDRERKTLTLSELLPTRSRTFHLALQIGLLLEERALERILADASLTTDESRALGRVALANAFAGAVLMPYDALLEAARETRYDIDVIGRRFKVGFEQVCHRLTALRRPGALGIPFHFMRIDLAGNISKRFMGSGMRFPRFSGACPKLGIFEALRTPGMIRAQVETMPDGARYFTIARTVQRDSGGWHAPRPMHAVCLGCRLERAREIVYSDGMNLEDRTSEVPVGVTCAVCERADCEQRALPSIRRPLMVDPDVRGPSLYAPAEPPRL